MEKNPFRRIAEAAGVVAALAGAPTEAPATTLKDVTNSQLYNQPEQIAALQLAYRESVQKVKQEVMRLAELERHIPPGLIHGPEDLTDTLKDELIASLSETQALITELSERAAHIFAETGDSAEFDEAPKYISELRSAQRSIDAALRNQPTVDYDGVPTPSSNTKAVLDALEKNLTQVEPTSLE
jgi:hypothetical protein